MSSPVIPWAGKAADAGRFVQSGSKGYVCAYYDGSGPAALTTGVPVALSYDNGDDGYNPKVIAIATLAVYRYIVVSRETTTTAGWYWFQYKGAVSLNLLGTSDIGIGDYIEVINANSTCASLDHATVRSVNSIGTSLVAWTTDTTPALKSCYLIGDPVITAAT